MSDARKINISIIKAFQLPAGEVFDTWLSPALIRQWLGRNTAKTTQVEVEPREGGEFIFKQQHGNDQKKYWGTYRIVDRPHGLAFSWHAPNLGQAGEITIAFLATQTGCKIKLTHQLDAKFPDQADIVRKNWTAILDAMEQTLLESRPRETVL